MLSLQLFIHQVGLALYLANMFKAMKSASMQQEADFARDGHPGLFRPVLRSPLRNGISFRD